MQLIFFYLWLQIPQISNLKTLEDLNNETLKKQLQEKEPHTELGLTTTEPQTHTPVTVLAAWPRWAEGQEGGPGSRAGWPQRQAELAG